MACSDPVDGRGPRPVQAIDKAADRVQCGDSLRDRRKLFRGLSFASRERHLGVKRLFVSLSSGGILSLIARTPRREPRPSDFFTDSGMVESSRPPRAGAALEIEVDPGQQERGRMRVTYPGPPTHPLSCLVLWSQ